MRINIFIIGLLLMLCGPVKAVDCSGAYKRSCYRHWIDADHDGQDTRQEVLERDSYMEVKKNWYGRITSGLWCGEYTGRCTTSPAMIQIDHRLALGEIHKIGGNKMSYAQRKAIANDMDNLVAVHRTANQQKSDRDTFDFIPPNLSSLGSYIRKREFVRDKYQLGYQLCEPEAIDLGIYLSTKVEYGIRLYRLRDKLVNSDSDFVEVFLRNTFERCLSENK